MVANREEPLVISGEGRFVVGDCLGNGSHAEVLELRPLPEGRSAKRPLATKRPLVLKRLLDPTNEHHSRLLTTEWQRLNLLGGCSATPAAVGLCTVGGRLSLVMTRCPGRLLTHYKGVGRNLTLPDKVLLLAELSRAVDELHRAGVIHWDLRPSNVLLSWIDGKPRFHIIDLMFSAEIGHEPRLYTHDKSDAYVPPELRLRPLANSTPLGDAYSLGKLTAFVLDGHVEPTRHGDSPQVLSMAHSGEDPMHELSRITTSLSAWSPEPPHRMSVSDALAELDEWWSGDLEATWKLLGPGMEARVEGAADRFARRSVSPVPEDPAVVEPAGVDGRSASPVEPDESGRLILVAGLGVLALFVALAVGFPWDVSDPDRAAAIPSAEVERAQPATRMGDDMGTRAAGDPARGKAPTSPVFPPSPEIVAADGLLAAKTITTSRAGPHTPGEPALSAEQIQPDPSAGSPGVDPATASTRRPPAAKRPEVADERGALSRGLQADLDDLARDDVPMAPPAHILAVPRAPSHGTQ